MIQEKHERAAMPDEIWLDGYPTEMRNLCGKFAVCLTEDSLLTKYVRAPHCEKAAGGEGWKLVPIEPTKEMVEAGEATECEHGDIQCGAKYAYKAMIEAAPALEATPSTPTAEEMAAVREALEKEERSHIRTIEQRDHAQDMADQLAQKIADYVGADIGEHSNANCPWENALEIDLPANTSPTSEDTAAIREIIKAARGSPAHTKYVMARLDEALSILNKYAG